MAKTKRTAHRRSRSALPAACAAVLTAALLLCGCSCTGGEGGTHTDTSDTGKSGGRETVTDPTTRESDESGGDKSSDTSPETNDGLHVNGGADEAELRAYYERLVAELRQSLVDEKSERYISDYEYKTRLDALEAELERLREQDKQKEQETARPISNVPDPVPVTERETQSATEAETESPVDAEIPTVSFRYGVKNGLTTIHEYLGTGRTVAIPATVNGYPVKAIADNAFRDKGVSAVILPDTVESIGWFAFCGCFGLETVSIPASVTSIAYGAFDGCPNLTVLCVKGSYADTWAQSYGLRIQYI